MDEVVIKYYRHLLREGFKYAGSIENPSIFIDSVGERIRVCGGISDYMHIYIDIREDLINDIKYMCMCDPTANVAVEVLCDLVIGKTVTEAENITEDTFSEKLGSRGEEFRKKAQGFIKLLNRGLSRYRGQEGARPS